jgi:NAD(P)H-quinone oxidoreductase subunit 4L
MILQNTLFLAACLFVLGLYGVMTSRNIVRVLMSLELLLNGVNLNFVTFSSFLDPHEIKGQVFALFIMALAAAEAAIGLALLLAIVRRKGSVDLEDFNLLKW